MAQVYISLGSNIEAEKYLQFGLQALKLQFGPLIQSSIYESESVGFNGNNYLNMVVCAQTTMTVDNTLMTLKQIELNNGRLPNAQKLAPRTLDLDLLLYDDLIADSPVTLPRGDITKHAFVLWPLAEITPHGRHPVLKKTYGEIWASFDSHKQKIWPISPPIITKP